MWPRTGWSSPVWCRVAESRAARELTRYRKTQIDDSGQGDPTPGEGPPRRRDQAVLGGIEGHDPVLSGHDRGPHRRGTIPGRAGATGQGSDAVQDGRPRGGVWRASSGPITPRWPDGSWTTSTSWTLDRLSGRGRARVPSPFEPAVTLLCTIPGWQRRTAEVFLAETGGDMTSLPHRTAPRLVVAPGPRHPRISRETTTSGNQTRQHPPVPSPHRGSQIRRPHPATPTSAPNTVASPPAEARTKPPSPSPTPWSWPPGTCSPPASPTLELGPDFYTFRIDPERQACRLTHQLEELGYTVTIAPAA